MTIKRYTVILLLPFFMFQPLLAQESVGHSEPDNIQPLLDYRLPAWGYSNFYWDFSLDGNFFNTTQDDDIEDNSHDHQASGSISPVYNRFMESESRDYRIFISPGLTFNNRDRETLTNTEQSSHNSELNLIGSGNNKFYLDQSDLFLIGSLTGNFTQHRSHTESQTSDNLNLNRSFRTTFSAGVGYGRLRNVNPMLRSLRMNERYQAVNPGQTLSHSDLMMASEQFTKSNGYQQIYDRPQKYFWEDMDNMIDADLSALNPYDLLYVTETTSETIGSRREGWEVRADVGLRFRANYFRNENRVAGSESSDLSSNTFLIPSVSGIWSKNISLNTQFSLSASYQYFREITGDNNLSNHFITTSGSWLYNISD
ncbi:MAG: hypothetical protein WD381_02515, partial [Balneolaceae bacterium]